MRWTWGHTLLALGYILYVLPSLLLATVPDRVSIWWVLVGLLLAGVILTRVIINRRREAEILLVNQQRLHTILMQTNAGGGGCLAGWPDVPDQSPGL
ncbi:MAG: hypothetical protein HC898_06240 [Phycisphaerales bacterium]|nr:hypothetical protein [Phycisphaerales bacterium]